MKVKNLSTKLIQLPSHIEFTLFLIKEELKSSKLFNGLSKIGFDDRYYRSELSAMILESVGFTERPDDLFELYFKLLDRYSKKVAEDHDNIIKQAFNLYVDLTIEKRKRSE